ncbi:MAG: type II toxin-antitoxin system VapC family toxin [Blastocatellia bacterium]
MSAVVMQELVAGAVDKQEIQGLRTVMSARLKSGRLLVPDHEDWFQAGRVLNTILRNEKRLSTDKKTPRFSEGKKQSLIRDVLIARTAKRQKLTVISDNKDFPLIQRYYEFDWVSGKEFFN